MHQTAFLIKMKKNGSRVKSVNDVSNAQIQLAIVQSFTFQIIDLLFAAEPKS